jgi:hypothetical protein
MCHGHIFGGTEGAGSRFHVLRYRNRFRWYHERRVQFSCFVLSDSFSAELRALGPFFMFCAPEIVFDGTEDIGSRLHVLHSRTHFRRYRGRRVPFSCFTLPDSFGAVTRALGPIFMFCAPELILDDTEGVGVQFSCFPLPYSFGAVPRVLGPIFKICAPGLIFDGTEDVGSRFHVLRSRIHF